MANAPAPDDWYDTSPVCPAPLSEQDEAVRERQARKHLDDAARAGVLPKADKESWAATGNVDMIGRVLLATTYTSTGAPAEIDPTYLSAALTLLGPARRDVDRLEAQLIMLARGQGLTWRFVAEALGLQSPQAAAQRWTRLTGNNPPPA